ncbi:MAG: hypothetical protein QXF56_01660 [Candidatus Micrarchaeia archaeon]
MLEKGKRYLQIAFNDNVRDVNRILPQIPFNERIIIEAGTPFIKREGQEGIYYIVSRWPGIVVADIKTMDGALEEVQEVASAGAKGATVLGAASKETIELFIKTCKQYGLISMIDMLNVVDPLKVLMQLRQPPDVVILHLGRDEETVRGKVIQYRHIRRIKSKFDVLISAAGGVDLREAQSAVFNGADIVVVNVVEPDDPWKGIKSTEEVRKIAVEFLKAVE